MGEMWTKLTFRELAHLLALLTNLPAQNGSLNSARTVARSVALALSLSRSLAHSIVPELKRKTFVPIN